MESWDVIITNNSKGSLMQSINFVVGTSAMKHPNNWTVFNWDSTKTLKSALIVGKVGHTPCPFLRFPFSRNLRCPHPLKASQENKSNEWTF